MMDNFRFDMTSEGQARLKAALALFDARKVVGYRVDAENGLILYQYESPRMVALPFPMTLDQAADFANGWLACADFGEEPDHDGSNGRGWQLYTEDWGRVAGEHQAFAAIKPAWAMYGK